jgi:hypothetical protein
MSASTQSGSETPVEVLPTKYARVAPDGIASIGHCGAAAVMHEPGDHVT